MHIGRDERTKSSIISSYGKVFRLIFVIFSLYLMGDVFFRWDGFSYYASLQKYIPSVALASVLWSVLAAVTALLIWLPLSFFTWACNGIGLKIRIHHLLLYMFVVLVLGALVWQVKIIIWQNVRTTFQFKFITLMAVLFLSAGIVWFFRNKTAHWIDSVQERIAPVVWLFGVFVSISALFVAFHIVKKGINNETPKKIIRTALPDISRPNILLVTFDALSARNMSVYGYHKQTTPFISKWAEEASLFTRVESTSNYTAPTTASLMTGKSPWTHLRYSRMQASKPIKTDTESLPAYLKKHGYYNMLFIANNIASAKNLAVLNSVDVAPPSSEFWAYASFSGKFHALLVKYFADDFAIYNWFFQDDFIINKLLQRLDSDVLYTTSPPEKAFNSFLSEIDDIIQEPFFAWIHFNPPHSPYLPSEEFKGVFDDSDEMRSWKGQLAGRLRILDHVGQYNRFPEDVKIFKARYDEFILYCDRQFEKFIKQLEKRDILNNTVIMLSSDHGESFEHNTLLHGGSLFEPETNIPLIIREPHNTNPRVINNVVSQKDIPATIIDLADIPLPSWMEGQSLVPLMRDKNIPLRPVFSMNLEHNRLPPSPISKGTIAVWEGEYKLIYYLEKDESMLFDLARDPYEMNNRIQSEPEIGERLIKLIQESLEKANERISGGE